MRFGSFVFPVSHAPERDKEVIDNTLAEIGLAEELGFDAIWLTEHHFDGACVYVDPVVFAAAVAVRTRKVKIGFAVAEMAFHHPVQLASQTALLDNLSEGRLIVGTGRGSAFNEYEYIGFGVDMAESLKRLPEAEDLLVRAWTTENLRFDGEFWQVSFPRLRPTPYQKPHPPLVRACISEKSTLDMARLGRPILMGIQDLDTISQRLYNYRLTLEQLFATPAVENILNETWVAKDVFVAETHARAKEIAEEGFSRERKYFRDARLQYNPGGTIHANSNKYQSATESVETSFILGTSNQVADQIAELRDAGTRNLMLKLNTGEMRKADVTRSMRLLGEKIIPLFQ